MSDPRVEPGLDKQLQTDAAASKNVSSQAPTERRAHPERVLPSSAPSTASLRNSPHGVRAQPAPAPLPRPGAHPRSRHKSSTWQPPRIALPAFHRSTLHRPTLRRPALHRPTWRLSPRQALSLAVGLFAVIAVVSGLVLLIPSKPVAISDTGNVRQIDFRAATQPPTGDFRFGPYFVAQGTQLLMMGSDGNTSTVWSSSDGSAWTSISAAGSFAAATQRFVVLGFSDDGNGGLVAVGDAFVSGSKVTASAWHSRDGRTWTPAALDFPTNAEMIGLASRPGALVAAGNGVAWFSQDGTSWAMEALPNATGYVPRAVRTWSGGFAIVAVGASLGDRHSAAWVSTDGRVWTQAATSLDGFQAQDLVGYGNGLVAVGSQTLTPAELATPSPSPSPSPSPTASASGPKKPTAKPTKSSKSPSASGSAGASSGASGAASPSPTATPSPAVETAASWSSSDGIHWFRSTLPATPASLAIESVTQVQDSLVAVGSEPGSIPGASAAPTSPLTLWVSDDGTTWKPIKTSAPALASGRLAPFGSHLVLAGIGASGALSVLTGDVALGSPLPAVVVTPTPAFSLTLHSGNTPMIAGITAQDTLGPVVTTSDRFLVFVSSPTGTTVWSSSDGNAWAQEADPAALTATGPKGIPVVADAVRDGQGGIVAVGKITGTSGDSPAIWRLAGESWTAATITGAAPTAFSSVAAQRGSYVAAAGSDGGARLFFSDDGMTWIEAAIPGATGYTLSVTSWSGGFIASGSNPDGSGKVSVWTSADGLTWTARTDWKLPAKSGPVYGAGSGLVTTSTSVTGDTSWWWSADGKSWQDSKLTTTGGCWGAVDAGFLAITAPPAGSDNKWSVFASKDAHSWQQPMTDTFSFGVPAPCRMASLGGHVIVVGWLKSGVLEDFYGDLTGL